MLGAEVSFIRISCVEAQLCCVELTRDSISEVSRGL